jgi:Z1 domain
MPDSDLTHIPSPVSLDADALARWRPQQGAVTSALVERIDLPPTARTAVVGSAARTLARCGNPDAHDAHAQAHLVVGEVQSGKTLAFTTVMALARDNGYRLVVVIAGTKNNLMEQTIDRLDEDLLGGDGGANPWRTLVNPDTNQSGEMATVLGEIDGAETLVCFVLKNAQRLSQLAQTIAAAGGQVELSRVPALVIDDEADQASLNLKAKAGQASSTYAAIQQLRDALPRHDFLMYTATPQGPLLIALDDQLSPETVTVLRSGEGYVGGHELFVARAADYVRNIPDAEVQIAIDPDSPDPPPTLRAAIATFLLALVIAQERGKPKPLAMLIHPDVKRAVHDRHLAWAQAITKDLSTRLADPTDAAFRDVVQDVFAAPYADLARTVANIEPLDSLVARVPQWARHITVRLVNQNAQREIRAKDWRRHAGWIVIGGNKLDRGFTVKNLAITYMPRGPGLSHADTLQQRGRFFGYKADYLDICRGWFNADTQSGFEDYVVHERTLQLSLIDVETQAQPLRSWRRQLLLSPSLKPTRKQVINLPLAHRRVLATDGWFAQRFVFVPETAAANRAVAQPVFDRWRPEALPAPIDPRPTPHYLADVAVADVMPVLADWATDHDDRDRLLGVSLFLRTLLDENPELGARILFADDVQDVDRARRRQARASTAPERDREVNVFQGRGSSGAFPGDRKFVDEDRPTFALFLLDVSEFRPGDAAGLVPVVALHLPSSSQALIVQD